MLLRGLIVWQVKRLVEVKSGQIYLSNADVDLEHDERIDNVATCVQKHENYALSLQHFLVG